MYENLRCIALRTIKYDDRRNILSVWSAERGRIGLLMPAGSSREALRRRALTMPLGIFEGQVDFRSGFDLFNIRDIRPLAVLPDIYGSPSKTVVAMFVAEVLDRVLREAPADMAMTQFIFDSVKVLTKLNPRGTAAFPLVFLTRLGAFIGIEPDMTEWRPGMYFDMTGGVYRTTESAIPGSRTLSPSEAAVAQMMQRLTYAASQRLCLSPGARHEILDTILDYYSIHHTSLKSLHTTQMLHDLLNS